MHATLSHTACGVNGPETMRNEARPRKQADKKERRCNPRDHHARSAGERCLCCYLPPTSNSSKAAQEAGVAIGVHNGRCCYCGGGAIVHGVGGTLLQSLVISPKTLQGSLAFSGGECGLLRYHPVETTRTSEATAIHAQNT